MRASQMHKGQTIKIDGKLYSIVDYQHVKLGKGGAVYQTKLKSLTDGSIQNVRIRSDENVEEATRGPTTRLPSMTMRSAMGRSI